LHEAASVVGYKNRVSIRILVVIHDKKLMKVWVVQRESRRSGPMIVNEARETRPAAFNILTVYLTACVASRGRFYPTEYSSSGRK
jgi:hypothetical protein